MVGRGLQSPYPRFDSGVASNFYRCADGEIGDATDLNPLGINPCRFDSGSRPSEWKIRRRQSPAGFAVSSRFTGPSHAPLVRQASLTLTLTRLKRFGDVAHVPFDGVRISATGSHPRNS